MLEKLPSSADHLSHFFKKKNLFSEFFLDCLQFIFWCWIETQGQHFGHGGCHVPLPDISHLVHLTVIIIIIKLIGFYSFVIEPCIHPFSSLLNSASHAPKRGVAVVWGHTWVFNKSLLLLESMVNYCNTLDITDPEADDWVGFLNQVSAWFRVVYAGLIFLLICPM